MERELEGILEDIPWYDTNTFEKITKGKQTFKTKTVSSLNLRVDNEINYIEFNAYVGREMIGQKVIYHEKIMKIGNNGRLYDPKISELIIRQELTPKDKTLPTYRAMTERIGISFE